ncbi:MAG: glycosyltransferase family 4 protein [Bacteroidota bacterium]|nr:glycosyltransferase family 4 protein [Bacteroidota bacterium]
MGENKRILFSSTIYTSFIKEDFNILEKHFVVHRIIGSGFIHIIKLLFSVPKAEVTFTWFASVYSAFVVFFSRLFGKKSVIVIGGVDVADYKEINYGIWLSWWKSKFVRYAIRNADKILSVDPFLIAEAKRLANYDGKNIVYLPTGYDYNFWKPEGKKEDYILSVGACEDEWRMMKKGFDKLIEAAVELPEIQFKIIGIKEELFKKIKPYLPKNVEVITFVERETLLKYYQKAKVYTQISFTEGLPNSLCEAMLCECIPVGTNRGGIPTGIGKTGFIIEYGDIGAMKEAFRNAIKLPSETGKKARQHVVENFPIHKRESSLKAIIQDLTK